MTDSNKPAQKFYTPLQERMRLEQEEILARAARLDRTQHTKEEFAGSDRRLPANQRHDYNPEAAKKKNFDQKIYIFPESFHALRRELDEHYPTLFNEVNPETGTSLAYDMAFNAPQFISTLNGALDLTVQMDSDNVSNICLTFLNALRVKRGVSKLVY